MSGLFLLAAVLLSGQSLATQHPNILVIWGDDIGNFILDRVMEAMTKPHGGGN
jgi:hypothetical protein